MTLSWLRLCCACTGSAGRLQQGERGALQAVKGGSRSRYGSSSVPCRPRRMNCLGCLAGTVAACRKSGVATQISTAVHIFLHVTRAAMLPAHSKSQAKLLALLVRAPPSELLLALTGRQQACKLAVTGDECGLDVKAKALSRRSRPQQCSPASGTFLLVASAMRQVHSGAVATGSTSRYRRCRPLLRGSRPSKSKVEVCCIRRIGLHSLGKSAATDQMRSARLQGRYIDFLGGRYGMAGLLGAVFMRYLDTCETYFAAALQILYNSTGLPTGVSACAKRPDAGGLQTRKSCHNCEARLARPSPGVRGLQRITGADMELQAVRIRCYW